jgi:hypothetical protein
MDSSSAVRVIEKNWLRLTQEGIVASAPSLPMAKESGSNISVRGWMVNEAISPAFGALDSWWILLAVQPGSQERKIQSGENRRTRKNAQSRTGGRM